jgi:hypothetical protein
VHSGPSSGCSVAKEILTTLIVWDSAPLGFLILAAIRAVSVDIQLPVQDGTEIRGIAQDRRSFAKGGVVIVV